ncbi:hypothetical protein B7463_g1812, partial [Scytalidium lignicola]
MQPSYRGYPPQAPPQKSPHTGAAARRGVGPMVAGPHPPNAMAPAQLQAAHQAQLHANELAKRRARKPTDKNIPDGIEDYIIGDGVQRYRDLRDLERRLDATMTRKRLDIQDAVNRNVKRYRTLRIWISNTVEDQPWQATGLDDVDAFDFSSNVDSSYRVKIEGRLLDEEEEADSDDEDALGHSVNLMDEGVQEKKKRKPPTKQHRFSHFFKAMTVEFDRSRAKDGADQNVEWKKPAVTPNATNLPNSADFDQLEFKRGGDENINITINLVRDETPERFRLSPALAEIMDTNEATRAEVVMGIWEYIKAMGLQEEDEKRSFDCDDRLRAILQREKGYIPFIPDAIIPHLSPLPFLQLHYTIRVDPEFHKDPQPTIYDVRVALDDPLPAALLNFVNNPEYAHTLREIASMNDSLAVLIQSLSHSKSKHAFFNSLSKNPAEFINKWLSSQKRDLEVITGEAMRGGGEDAMGDEWRKGGKNGIWGSDHVRESVNIMVGSKSRV